MLGIGASLLLHYAIDFDAKFTTSFSELTPVLNYWLSCTSIVVVTVIFLGPQRHK
jgi:hypothetical protein